MVANSKARRCFIFALCLASVLVVLISSLSGFSAPKHALAAGTLIAPTEGTITQYFLDQTLPDETGGSYYDYNDQLVTLPKNSKFAWHDGVDIAVIGGPECTTKQAPVYAAGPGTVIFAGYQTGFGWSVEIDHGQSVSSNGKYVFTLYGHMGTADVKNKPGTSCLVVTNGQKVTAGQLIGYQGQSGNVTGVHLHWSVKVNPTADSWKGSIYASPDFYSGLHLTEGNTPLLTSLAGHFQISPPSVSVTTTSGQNPSPQTLTMNNGGNSPLTWKLSSSLPSWLTVSPISGALASGGSQSISLTFSLPATTGTYSTALAFSDPSSDNSPASVPVNVTVVGWATVASPNLMSGGFSGVAEVSPSDIWAVGGYITTGSQPLTEHWDGNSWTIIPNPGSNGSLHGITALASNNVWAVGQYYTNGAYQTLIENWNGSSWSIIPSPNNSTRDNYLYSVSGVFPNDIWAVGKYIPSAGGADQPLIEHWDGNSWTIVSSPDVGSGNDSSLESISYLLPNDIWAVGFTTDGYPNFDWTPLTEHYDGTSWHIVPSPTVNPANPWRLEGVMMFSSNDVWAVGVVYNNPPPSPVPDLIEHWDGNNWTIVQSPIIGTEDALFSISGTGPNDIWAAGYYSDSSGATHTLIKHWDGSAWSIISSPDGASYRNDLFGVVAVASNDVWAVGYDQDNINALDQPLILRYH